eukprot:CAMPEP_0181337286 /NCGR_PEP_ID=MMETSP1101-20121128/27925_1 /TAXON_ID=46948 /ORGANISM="Rhodomonas abbreviata, Strain Caron Lab Isolate" /LENGTH=112 /DNA_ID=CAMNT_0023447745 /DNA_START=38 /DNA_END=373 /DNA_ORIENTATION=-
MLAAAFRGDVEGLKEQLKEGADVNWPDGKWGTTPLMAAAAPTQRLAALEFLLRRQDTDRDALNKRGMTALHQAAWYGQDEAVHLLLTLGADPEVKTPEGHTALEMAQLMKHD